MAYTLDRVQKEFIEVCEKAGAKVDIPIVLNGRLSSTLGRVTLTSKDHRKTWQPQKVEFSKNFINDADDESINKVIRHEACHYIATYRTKQDQGHNAYFKSICKEIGVENDGIEITPNYLQRTSKYIVICPNCNKKWYYARKGRVVKTASNCMCPECTQIGLEVQQNW